MTYLPGVLGLTLVARMSEGGEGWEATAESCWEALVSQKGPDIARAWFIGSNDELLGETPVEAIRAGLFTSVWTAVQIFLDQN